MQDPIGIDFSKDKLDAYWLSKGEHKQFDNDKAGVKALALWAIEAGGSRVIFESTGIYHRGVETGLAYHNISFARVNPRQARRFCEGAGQLAKMGALLQLKADEPKSETLHDVKQLSTARQALIKDRTAAKARLAATTHRLLSRQIKRRLSQIERDLSQIADLVDTIIASDAELRAKADILVSIPASPRSQPVRSTRTCPSLGN